MFRPEPPAEMSAWEAIMAGNGASSGFGDDWLKFAGIKIFYDGGMTLKTALMRDVYPDSHDNYHGIAQQTPERLKQLVSICNRYNWRVGVHVVGDLGIDHVLDAFEAADKEKSIRDRRFILIHASLIRPEQMERAHRLGVRIDFQNVFMWDKAATVERFLGRATADRAVPTRTLIEKMGIDSLGAGTDFPVNPDQSVPQHVRHGDAEGSERKRLTAHPKRSAASRRCVSIPARLHATRSRKGGRARLSRESWPTWWFSRRIT